jgi:light-regulated signal transduction histidine kinase (bacteriophytochrome)
MKKSLFCSLLVWMLLIRLNVMGPLFWMMPFFVFSSWSDNHSQHANTLLNTNTLKLPDVAAYCASGKKKRMLHGYEPMVSVTTPQMENQFEIRMCDNGVGISGHVINKIFQPFFTTRPPGECTGLGWALSYDIIKVHGSELKVKTKEGEFAKFIIKLPKQPDKKTNPNEHSC